MKKIIYLTLSAAFLVACSTSNDVVSSNKIQKRKYTKGWHIKKSKNYKSTKSTNEEELAKNDGERKIRPEENNISLASKSIEFKVDKSINRDLEELNLTRVDNPETVVKTENSVSSKNDSGDKLIVKNATEQITKVENDKEVIQSTSKTNSKKVSDKDSNSGSDDTYILLLYVLAVFIPFLAVGIVTDWDLSQVLLNVLLTLLFWIPGVIHALIVVNKNT